MPSGILPSDFSTKILYEGLISFLTRVACPVFLNLATLIIAKIHEKWRPTQAPRHGGKAPCSLNIGTTQTWLNPKTGPQGWSGRDADKNASSSRESNRCHPTRSPVTLQRELCYTMKREENREAIRRDVAATTLARVQCGHGVFVVL